MNVVGWISESRKRQPGRITCILRQGLFEALHTVAVFTEISIYFHLAHYEIPGQPDFSYSPHYPSR